MNTSCILTVIKNEHEYLDEWIRYHLNLGIDHIFIFEDINYEEEYSLIKEILCSINIFVIISSPKLFKQPQLFVVPFTRD